jgi:hypothetical protein
VCALFASLRQGEKTTPRGVRCPCPALPAKAPEGKIARGVATTLKQRPDPLWRNVGYACLFASPTPVRPDTYAAAVCSAHTRGCQLFAEARSLQRTHRTPPCPAAWWPYSLDGRYQLACNRLTRVQRLLARNPAPLQSSTCFSILGPDGIFATTTKIRAGRRSAPAHAKSGTAGPLCPPTRRCPAPIAVAAAACCKARAVRWLGRHPFSEPPASAGELLHTPQRIPTFMATALLSRGGDVLCGFWV